MRGKRERHDAKFKDPNTSNRYLSRIAHTA
jgi:hypothetical protein